MKKPAGSKPYSLQERTFLFAQQTRSFVKMLPRTLANREDARQLVRSSGSVGANYIEANEALSDKDFLHRIRIARKEAKESAYWLRLVDCGEDEVANRFRSELASEVGELLKILSTIIYKRQE